MQGFSACENADMETNVTPETNAARLLADGIAGSLARAQDKEPPEVEELPPDKAAFSIETPIGAFYVSVTAL